MIAVRGEVDLRSGPYCTFASRSTSARRGPDLIVDLTAVSFLDIAGLATLMAVWEATMTAEVEFIVVARTRAVLRR
ncbi:STAS domain-containing protein [Lentzea tibetensis]|uniref:STAS domain-containing protein n=1 Tax=Lentzea tibetensis TaxID=2591470 RepID=UPI0016492E1D|nr:STAS domain-containing protein [Lentzea tibetensis]